MTWGRDVDRHTVDDVEFVVLEAGEPDGLCALAVSAENDCDDTRMFLDCICCSWRAEVTGILSVTTNQLIAVAEEHRVGRLGLVHGPDPEPRHTSPLDSPLGRLVGGILARAAADLVERRFITDRILSAPASDGSGAVVYDYEAAVTPPRVFKYGATIALPTEQIGTWELSSAIPDPTGYLRDLAAGVVDPPGGVRPDAGELPPG